MRVVHGKDLSRVLRAAADAAQRRVWVASPFVGGWSGNVRRILGTAWQDRATDVRLLTDISAKGVKKSTALQFGRRGTVRSLAGLHAKIYIADNFVLVCSANLTGTAFSKRYEIGLVLSGVHAHRAVQLFTYWWKLDATTGVDPEKIEEPAITGKDPGEPQAAVLVTLHDLPPDAKDTELPTDIFGDYDLFLTCYEQLMADYFAVQRLWKQTPKRFEMDGFLNYLYRNAAATPSNPYRKKKPRHLTTAARRAEVRRYAKQFSRDWDNDAVGDDDASWRTKRAKRVRHLLDKNRRSGITRAEFKELLLQTNSMHFYRVNLAKAVNPRNRTLGNIRQMLLHLVDEELPIQRRMAACSSWITGAGKSAIQELVGFRWPERYPLRNTTANAGLRFFGFDVRVG